MVGESILNEIIKKTLSLGASRVYLINPQEIPVSWKASLLCLDCNVHKNYFMRRWSCPPYSPLPEKTKEILSHYDYALVVNVEARFWPLTNHSYNTLNPLIQINQKIFCHYYWRKLHFIMLKMKRLLSTEYKVFSWGSSPCHGCFKCSYPFRCRRPDFFLFSPEASGIDLYLLAKKLNIPIEIPPKEKIQLLSLMVWEKSY